MRLIKDLDKDLLVRDCMIENELLRSRS